MTYNKKCKVCSITFTGLGPAALYCNTCVLIKKEEQLKKNRERIAKERAASGQIKMPGVGKGGYPHAGKASPHYKHGRYVFETLRYKIKEERRYCERCFKDLKDLSGKGIWAVHHKNHDHWDHRIENLELLCRRCHAIEHECWKAFDKVQRLSREGVESSDSKS